MKTKFITTFKDLEPYLTILSINKTEKEKIENEISKLTFPFKFPERYLKRITNISPVIKEIQNTYKYKEGEKEIFSRYKREVLNIITPRPIKFHIDVTHAKEYARIVGVAANKDTEPVKGIVQVYKRRALMVPFGTCAGHCLWCFRTKTESSLSNENVRNAINWLKIHKEIYEVILTGGEPLIGPVEKIEEILKKLREIEHIKIIRVHTRMPIYLPERLDNKFFKMIKKYTLPREGKSLWVVTQIVHPMELSGKTMNIIKKFLYSGIPVLNQAPIMHSINDNQRTFNELHDRLIFCGVKPYYDIALILTPDLSNVRFYTPIEKIKELQTKYYLEGSGLGMAKIIVPIMGKKYSVEELKKLEEEGILPRITKSQIYTK